MCLDPSRALWGALHGALESDCPDLPGERVSLRWSAYGASCAEKT